MPGIPRHKFRVPTSNISENVKILTLRGTEKIKGGPGQALPSFLEIFVFFALIFIHTKEPENVPLLFKFQLDAYKGGSSNASV